MTNDNKKRLWYESEADIYAFPPLETALTEPNGLLAIGGDLSLPRLLSAYRHGAFPWYEEGQSILWWSPCPRAVLFPDQLHISHSLKKSLRAKSIRVTCDQAFSHVITACQAPRITLKTPDQNSTWITEAVKTAYIDLFRHGYAHSIETWEDNELVGGLYGVSFGQLFFGESMFSRKTDASKIAFVHLAQRLTDCGFPLIDCQIPNPHLTRLGATTITRTHFQAYLQRYSSNPFDSSDGTAGYASANPWI